MPTVQTQKTQTAPKQKPAAEFKDGNLRITIWKKTDKNGTLHFSTLTTRSYRLEGKWHQTSFLGEYDSDCSIRLTQRAKEWMALARSASIAESHALAA